MRMIGIFEIYQVGVLTNFMQSVIYKTGGSAQRKEIYSTYVYLKLVKPLFNLKGVTNCEIKNPYPAIASKIPM